MSTRVLKRIDATEGPIFSKMISFVIPLILTNVIQQLYTVADNIVVGRYSPDGAALGAIGSTSAVIAFLTALFAGFSVGTASVVSHDFGARDNVALSRGVHTSVILSASFGFGVGLIGFIFAEPILVALNTKSEFLSAAIVYMRIRCIGMPFAALYNCSAATLRSVGDSKTPLYILTASGLANVLLNLVFVLGFKMSADGVAFATLVSQILSVVFVFFVLIRRSSEAYSFKFSKLALDRNAAQRIMKFAIPGTIQGSVAHVMNVFLAGAVNTFSPEVIEAKTIASNIDNVLSTAIATYMNVSLTFTGQNRGAKKPERIKKSLFISILQACVLALIGGQIILLFREPLIGLFLNDSVYDVDVITAYATKIMLIIIPSYIISGATNSLVGYIKGLGYSLPPMVVSIIDMGIVRAIWIFLIFPIVNTMEFLYLIYPVSWGMNLILYSCIAVVIWKKAKAKMLLSSTVETK